MKRSTVIICALASCLGCSAAGVYAQPAQPAGSSSNPSQDQSLAAGGGVKTTKQSAAAYVPRAQIADLFEVEAGKVAMERAQKKDVKEFAKTMVDERARATTRFNAAVQKAGLAPKPAGLDTDHLNQLEALKTASGSAFDRLYVTSQVEAHEKALRLHQGYAAGGDNSALKAAAQEAVPVIQKHLEHIRQISAALASDS